MFPYAKAEPAPSGADPLVEVAPDPELGNEAFTYQLASGTEGTIHMDAVLEYNQDPSTMADLAMYQLTLQARGRYEESGLSAREVARAMHTSTSQLYRLLDPTNYNKSLHQLLALLNHLGYDVELSLTKRPPLAAS
jgi:hypothetical protein